MLMSQSFLLSFVVFIAEEFLKQSASQLTNHGLSKLIHCLKEDELCILFRNNHFITLYKYKASNHKNIDLIRLSNCELIVQIVSTGD